MLCANDTGSPGRHLGPYATFPVIESIVPKVAALINLASCFSSVRTAGAEVSTYTRTVWTRVTVIPTIEMFD